MRHRGPGDARLDRQVQGGGRYGWPDRRQRPGPGWTARYELVRPYPNQFERVVNRQVEDPPAT
jgi:hypothetical protein